MITISRLAFRRTLGFHSIPIKSIGQISFCFDDEIKRDNSSSFESSNISRRTFSTNNSNHPFVLSHPSKVDAKTEDERDRGRIICVTSGKGGVVSYRIYKGTNEPILSSLVS